MKLHIVSAAVLWLVLGSATAQPADPPSPQAARIERLAILLDLDEGQKVAVQKVMQEQREQMLAHRQQIKASGERPSREQMQEQRQQMQKDMLEKMRGILSDQQMKKFEVLTEDRPVRHSGMRPDKRH